MPSGQINDFFYKKETEKYWVSSLTWAGWAANANYAILIFDAGVNCFPLSLILVLVAIAPLSVRGDVERVVQQLVLVSVPTLDAEAVCLAPFHVDLREQFVVDPPADGLLAGRLPSDGSVALAAPCGTQEGHQVVDIGNGGLLPDLLHLGNHVDTLRPVWDKGAAMY